MRAMVVKRYGPPDVFEVREVPDPQPKPGEVVIRVKAVGVNFADLLQRMGIYPGTPKPPFVPGFEVSGVVEKVAEGARPATASRCAWAMPWLRLLNSTRTPSGWRRRRGAFSFAVGHAVRRRCGYPR